mgnify:FL=1
MERRFTSSIGKATRFYISTIVSGTSSPEATVAIHKPDRHDAKTIPIISMTANTFPDDIRLAKTSGMNDHFPKPINIGRLADIMKKWMANSKIPSPAK